MSLQTSNTILMIRPVAFTYNTQTAVNNSFQQKGLEAEAQSAAVQEFDSMVTLLRDHGVRVVVIEDIAEPHTPDSIFPNNWISFHQSDDAMGTIVLYPMFAPNRRLERKPHVLHTIHNLFHIENTIDLSHYEQQLQFLEGTGSLVLDRTNRIAYACLSPRTNQQIVEEWAEKLDYQPVFFHSVDSAGQPVYHTNVVMSVGHSFVLICLESIPDEAERTKLLEAVQTSGKTLITISLDQMNEFAGNMLEVIDSNLQQRYVMMSLRAFQSLTNPQILSLTASGAKILHSDLRYIEINGGGSARCMMAEVFLPQK